MGGATEVGKSKEHDREEAAATRRRSHNEDRIESGRPNIEACRAGMIEPLSDDAVTVNALMEVVYAVVRKPDDDRWWCRGTDCLVPA